MAFRITNLDTGKLMLSSSRPQVARDEKNNDYEFIPDDFWAPLTDKDIEMIAEIEEARMKFHRQMRGES